jgi:hypothetical protein
VQGEEGGEVRARCGCGTFYRVGSEHDCEASLRRRRAALAGYRELFPGRHRQSLKEGRAYWAKNNLAHLLDQAALMRARRTAIADERRSAVWDRVASLRAQRLGWARIAFMVGVPKSTLMEWSRK